MPGPSTIGLDYSHNNQLTLEASSYSDFTHFLFSSGYKLGKIQAGFDSLKKLETYDVIILSTPINTSLSPEEIEVLDEYVKKGGSLLIVSSQGGDFSNRSNLNELTQRFGFEFVSDEVYDSMNYVNLQKRPLLTKFLHHFITEQVKKVVYSSSCSLKILDFIEDDTNIKIDELIFGGLNCWRKIYNQEEKKWLEEDCPKIPLMAAIEYYEGKVVGFGNLSIFSSLGREYGFSALDNDIIIANILRWLTMGITEGKAITVKLNLELYYWADSVIQDQKWESISDIINVSMKYFKDHYKEIIEDILKAHEERLKKRKDYEKAKAEELSAEDKILELVPVRTREDLEDIMSALEEVTGEKFEIEIDLEEGGKEIEEIEEEKEIEETEKEKEIEETEKEKEIEETEEDKEIKKQISEELEKERKELQEVLKKEIEKEQEIIMEKAKEEVEKEFDKKFESAKAEKIEEALEKSIENDIERIKDIIMDKAVEDIERESEKIIQESKQELKKISEEDDESKRQEIFEKARKDLEKKRIEIMRLAKEKMEKDRKERIILIKEREIEIIKDNQEFLDGILEATDLFDAPILEKEKETENGLEYTSKDVENFEKDTSKHAFWHDKPTKAFRNWLKNKK